MARLSVEHFAPGSLLAARDEIQPCGALVWRLQERGKQL